MRDNQTDSKEPAAQDDPIQFPLDYFILPLLLSWMVPLVTMGMIGVTIVAITDPIALWQWPDSAEWTDVVYTIILLIGFIGMCYRRKWALWLTAISRLIWIVIVGIALGTPGFRQDWLFLFMMSIYGLLIVSSCFYALWQCSQFQKTIVSPRSPAGVPAK